MDIMLDLETMGNGPNAAIVAIGAVIFDPYRAEPGPKFYQTIDLESSVKGGGIIDASTVIWWLKQDKIAIQHLITGCESIDTVLNLFGKWIAENITDDGVRIWGDGAAFDNVILASAYRRHNIPQPWSYWNDRCYRTMRAMYPGIKMQRTGTAHIALDDAISQANHLIRIFNQLPETGVLMY